MNILNATISTLNVVLLALAVWRLASLAANETGPFGIFAFVRETAERVEQTNRGVGRWMRDFHFHEGLCCEWCNSMWFGIPIVAAWLLLGDVVVAVLLPFSLSALAIMVKFVVQNMEVSLDIKARRVEAMKKSSADLAEQLFENV